jgi:exopolyphosphatase / guanosine-5'-triphosphate,3'-diphosphate pyrophosphatase
LKWCFLCALCVSVVGTDNVAVIDIGSNSIKSLVATRGPQGEIVTVQTGEFDARISTGIGRARPQLTQEAMRRGLAAICRLLAGIAPLAPKRTVLVATSAVRDAANGGEFRERVRTATGHEIRILTGEEEANLIGRGLASDPALADLQDFYVFDLGGGSLECLTFRARRVEQTVSLPLGCVRLMEHCVKDPPAPFSDTSRLRVMKICREVFSISGFRFALPAGAAAVFAGGTITTTRAIFAERLGRPIAETSPLIDVPALRALLADAARRPLAERKRIPGLPAARADVFPTALATVIAVAEIGGLSAFRHSFHNLRYGLAAELLE